MPIKRTQKHESWMKRLKDIETEIQSYSDGLHEKYTAKTDKWRRSEEGSKEADNLDDLIVIINSLEEAFNGMGELFE